MDIKDLNKQQLLLLAILLSFVVSLATGITTVTLMDQAPKSVTQTITKIVKQTVEKVAPETTNQKDPLLSIEEQKLLQELKAIKPLTVSLYLKGEKEDKILGTGLFLGENKVIIASIIREPKEGEIYVVKSILGEKKISKVLNQDDFSILELQETKDIDISTEDDIKKEEEKTTDVIDKNI